MGTLHIRTIVRSIVENKGKVMGYKEAFTSREGACPNTVHDVSSRDKGWLGAEWGPCACPLRKERAGALKSDPPTTIHNSIGPFLSGSLQPCECP